MSYIDLGSTALLAIFSTNKLNIMVHWNLSVRPHLGIWNVLGKTISSYFHAVLDGSSWKQRNRAYSFIILWIVCHTNIAHEIYILPPSSWSHNKTLSIKTISQNVGIRQSKLFTNSCYGGVSSQFSNLLLMFNIIPSMWVNDVKKDYWIAMAEYSWYCINQAVSEKWNTPLFD